MFKRPSVNLLKKIYTGNLNLYRFKSVLTPSNKYYRPNTIALEYISKGKPITSEVINSLLLNQNVSITQQQLDELISLSSVKFDLPLTDQTYSALLGLIGKPKSKRSKPGYIYFLISIQIKIM